MLGTRPVAWVLVGCVASVGLFGCGSSHHRLTRSRSYSLPQVLSAFGAHGVTLRRSKERTTGGVVALVGRGGVKVLVDVGAATWSFGWTGEKPISQGNLIVFRPAAYEAPVSRALHDLH